MRDNNFIFIGCLLLFPGWISLDRTDAIGYAGCVYPCDCDSYPELPVCADNLKTFPNECYLDLFNENGHIYLEKTHNGPCYDIDHEYYQTQFDHAPGDHQYHYYGYGYGGPVHEEGYLSYQEHPAPASAYPVLVDHHEDLGGGHGSYETYGSYEKEQPHNQPGPPYPDVYGAPLLKYGSPPPGPGSAPPQYGPPPPAGAGGYGGYPYPPPSSNGNGSSSYGPPSSNPNTDYGAPQNDSYNSPPESSYGGPQSPQQGGGGGGSYPAPPGASPTTHEIPLHGIQSYGAPSSDIENTYSSPPAPVIGPNANYNSQAPASSGLSYVSPTPVGNYQAAPLNGAQYAAPPNNQGQVNRQGYNSTSYNNQQHQQQQPGAAQSQNYGSPPPPPSSQNYRAPQLQQSPYTAPPVYPYAPNTNNPPPAPLPYNGNINNGSSQPGNNNKNYTLGG